MTRDEYLYERMRVWRDAYLAAIAQGLVVDEAAEAATTARDAFDTAFPKNDVIS